ncbi:MAG: helix-turn-helix transcriptional regulator [Spirochaetota bacterium]
MDKNDDHLYNIDMSRFAMPVRVKRAERTYCSPSWHWINPVPLFDGYLFWLILDGKGKLRTETAEYELSRGACFLMHMWEHIEGTHDPKHTLVVPWIHFECTGGSPRLIDHPLEHRRVGNVTFISELAERAIRHLRDGNKADADHWMRSILLEIARQDKRPVGGNDPWIKNIDELCLRMQESPSQAMNIAGLAREYRCTPDHLIRVFKRITGTTPVDYLVRVRTERAKDMLLYSSQSIEEIALALGYADIYYFSRQFKERTGVPPSVYRRSGGATR